MSLSLHPVPVTNVQVTVQIGNPAITEFDEIPKGRMYNPYLRPSLILRHNFHPIKHV